MNWIDLAFIVFVGFYAFRGFHRGLVREAIDLVGFALGLVLSVRFYSVAGAPLRFLGVPDGWADIIGGSLIFLLFVVAAIFVAVKTHTALGDKAAATPLKVGGAAFAALWSGLFAAFMLVVLTVIPSPQNAQAAVSDSLVGRGVLAGGSPIYPILEDHAKKEARNLLFYLRQYFTQLEPEKPRGSTETEEFFKIQASNDIQIDPAAERTILDLVNKERTSRGLKPLVLHIQIREVARLHSADMYRRGYFAHRNPDNKDPFDRMAEGQVTFTYAGENLALAPTIVMVHQGLMNSPKHRDNILKAQFTDLGIAVYKGPYGLMVTQNFCSGCRV